MDWPKSPSTKSFNRGGKTPELSSSPDIRKLETMFSGTNPSISCPAEPRVRCRKASIGESHNRSDGRRATAAIPATLPAALIDMDDLLRRAATTAQRSRSKNTERVYNTALRTFAKFAASQGQTAFPADERTVAAFLQHRIDAGISPASLELALTAIRNAHRAGKQPDPTDDPNVRAVLHGYRRIRAAQGKVPQQTRGMSETDLAAMIAVAKANGDDILTVRDIAVISVLREGLLRRGECAALRVRDFSREPDGSGRLQITRSKTDQEGLGRTLFLGKQAADSVVKWLNAAPANGDAPLFRRIRRGGHVQSIGLAGEAVHKIVRERGKAAGIDGLSGHSGRVGMAQSLVSNGAGIGEVAVAGRWSSPSMVVHYASRQTVGQGAVAKYRGF